MHDVLTQFSIFFAIVPLTLSLFTIKIFPLSRYLFFILLLGLGTELYLMMYRVDWLPIRSVLIFYSFFESCTFLWLVKARAYAFNVRSLFKIVLFFSVPMLLLSIYLPSLSTLQFLSKPGLFNLVYEIVIAFVAGSELLKMTETKERLKQSPYFWITLAVFVYCFCTFFLVSMLTEKIARKIWYVHNAINISMLTMFSVALIIAWRQDMLLRSQERGTGNYVKSTEM